MISFSGLCLLASPAIAQFTNSAAAPLTAPSLPDTNLSILRVFGSLLLVIGLFLGGVWLFRNWQRLALKNGRVPKLNLLETRSLGGRQTIHVIGYQQERFLIAASPAGINLLSHLPSALETDVPVEAATASPSFAQALSHVIKGK